MPGKEPHGDMVVDSPHMARMCTPGVRFDDTPGAAWFKKKNGDGDGPQAQMLHEADSAGHGFAAACDYWAADGGRVVKMYASYETADEFVTDTLLACSTRYLYEVIREGRRCKLYVDVEWEEGPDSEQEGMDRLEYLVKELLLDLQILPGCCPSSRVWRRRQAAQTCSRRTATKRSMGRGPALRLDESGYRYLIHVCPQPAVAVLQRGVSGELPCTRHATTSQCSDLGKPRGWSWHRCAPLDHNTQTPPVLWSGALGRAPTIRSESGGVCRDRMAPPPRSA